jgi:hypothetical protein
MSSNPATVFHQDRHGTVSKPRMLHASTRRPRHARPARALHLGKTGALQRCAGATVLPRHVEHALRDPRQQPWLNHLVSRAAASGWGGFGADSGARPHGTGAHHAHAHAHAACIPRACGADVMCMLYTCGAYAVHMAHVTEAPRLSKAREVRHRRRRTRRCARRRTEGHVPRIVRGAAVTRQRAELGRHRSELRVRACEGRAAVARVPIPLRRPAQCGVQPQCTCTAHTQRACTVHCTAHARVCCGYKCSSSTAAGLYSR